MDKRTFTIRYARPDKIRVNWTERSFIGLGTVESVIYTVDGKIRSKSGTLGRDQEESSMEMAIGANAGVSRGISYAIPMLLMGKSGYYDYWKLDRLHDQVIDGQDCYAIRMETKGYGYTTFYLSKSNQLAVVRTVEDFEEKVVDAQRERAHKENPAWFNDGGVVNKVGVSSTTTIDYQDIQINAPLSDADFALKLKSEEAKSAVAPKPKQIEISSRILRLDRTELQKLVSVSDEKFNAPAKELFSHLLKVNIGGHIGVLNEKDMSQLLGIIDMTSGIDLLAAPKVIAKSGAKARVEVVREFRYPTEFTADRNNSGAYVPSQFKTRKLGLTIDATPTIVLDTPTVVELETSIELCDFAGWRRFKDGKYLDPEPVDLDINTMFTMAQPAFNTRGIEMKFQILTGQTLILRLNHYDIERRLKNSKEFELVLLTASQETPTTVTAVP